MDQALQIRQPRIPNKLTSARSRLRRFSQALQIPFRKSQIFDTPFISSPSRNSAAPCSEVVLPIEMSSPTPSTDSADTSMSRVMDGATERLMRRSNQSQTTRPGISAIFVHAGAGYHSTTNEHIHLGACNDAARMAMKFLKAGGSAVDAVEAAIKVLEDKEITNAGYGSNLSIEGIVECDATVVDHLGRSGACGATGQIRNPIHLARVILDASNKPLSLRRVPPNLLVGQGATDFAYEHNIPVVPHSMVVSKNARDRFLRWQSDLVRAEKNAARLTPRSSSPASSQAGEDEILDREYEERVRDQQRRDHMNAILHGTWNEGQPDSPQPSPRLEKTQTQLEPMPCPAARQQPTSNPTLYNDPSTTSAPHGRNLSPDSSPSKRPRFTKGHSEGHIRTRSLLGPSASNSELYKSVADTRMAYNELDISPQARPGRNDGPTSPIDQPLQARFLPSQPPQQQDTTRALFHSLSAAADEDMITDTVGAIAIDMYGNIAAGSSSGGIGMKHRGRVGPAALVGIGTAVVPADEQDPDGICVAAVTSGTGEHMATTMASQKCADRLYHNTRRARGGADVEATEEEAMESFVVTDFMGHPGVSGSNSAGAIGVMAVKKTPYASMHSDEKDAKCVMSRLGDHGTVVRGGRKIRC